MARSNADLSAGRNCLFHPRSGIPKEGNMSDPHVHVYDDPSETQVRRTTHTRTVRQEHVPDGYQLIEEERVNTQVPPAPTVPKVPLERNTTVKHTSEYQGGFDMSWLRPLIWIVIAIVILAFWAQIINGIRNLGDYIAEPFYTERDANEVGNGSNDTGNNPSLNATANNERVAGGNEVGNGSVDSNASIASGNGSGGGQGNYPDVDPSTLPMADGAVCNLTPEKAVDLLVANSEDRAFIGLVRKIGTDGFLIETAKTGRDAHGHPSNGMVIEWKVPAGYPNLEINYWAGDNNGGGFAAPIGSGVYSDRVLDDNNGVHYMHVVTVISGQNPNAMFESDGVSFYPCGRNAQGHVNDTNVQNEEAASAASEEPSGESDLNPEVFVSWTGHDGWVETENGEWNLKLDSPVEICLSENFPREAGLKYGAETSPGNWEEAWIGAGECTVNDVDNITYVPNR